MREGTDRYDAIVIGGGPTGSTAALVMSRAGLRVLVLDRAAHPRHHVGESFLPRNSAIIRELGLVDRLATVPHTTKLGAEFMMGDGQSPRRIAFTQGIPAGDTFAWNIDRSKYDKMLLDAAREAGAEVREGITAQAVPVMRDGDVELLTDAGPLRGHYLIDASGQQTFLGRALKSRRVLPHHQKIVSWGHFPGVFRHPGERAGDPFVAICTEGWFWLIPIDDERMSVGVVMDAAAVKHVGVPPHDLLRWAIERCPAVRERVKNSPFPDRTHVCADFSYRCDPTAGPGYFLAGDAAMFVDPIFSTGVCLGMMTGRRAAESVISLLRDSSDPGRVRREYMTYLRSSSKVFFRFIDLYYQHSFRELFLHGQGPLRMPGAVISLLAGHVFPRPPLRLIWRMKAFEMAIRLNTVLPMAPRVRPFSLLQSPCDPLKGMDPEPPVVSAPARAPVAVDP